MGDRAAQSLKAPPRSAKEDVTATDDRQHGDSGMLLSGWGRRPATSCDVRRLGDDFDPTLFAASSRGVIPRGLGRSYGDAAQNAGGVVVDMTSLDGIRRFDPLTGRVTSAAGTSLDDLLRVVVPAGWFLPVTPGTRFVTVGGAIAADVHGKNHPAVGGFGRHVHDLELATPEGERMTVSPGAAPDVFHATVGGMGLTGVITEATLQLAPIETSWMEVDVERVADLDEAMARMSVDDPGRPYAVAWLDLLARGRGRGRAVLTRGRHAAAEALPRRLRRHPLRLRPPRRGEIPAWTPGGLLNRLSMSAFNEAIFRRAPVSSQGRLEPLVNFFYPLDAIGDWNRLYGRQGFLQYQFVVPDGEENALRAVVDHLDVARCPVFFAVLKRLGAADGPLSFPVAGWTLAIDIPLGVAGLGMTLQFCDRIVAEAAGRVYLAKDSRLGPASFRHMYPDHAKWQGVRDRLDPHGRMRSDLARRLELVD